MSYNLAYSVLTPITNGETGLQLAQVGSACLDVAFGRDYGAVLPSSICLAIEMTGYPGFYFCARLADHLLLHLHAHLPLAVRHDAAGREVEPEPDELHRLEHAPLRWRRS